MESAGKSASPLAWVEAGVASVPERADEPSAAQRLATALAATIVVNNPPATAMVVKYGS